MINFRPDYDIRQLFGSILQTEIEPLKAWIQSDALGRGARNYY